MEKNPPSFLKVFSSSQKAGATALALLLLAAYFPVLQNGFIWDDDRYLTNNPFLVDFEGLKRLWLDVRSRPQYYPMVFTTFWVEHQLWDLNPVGYHINNVLLHAVNAILLWRVLNFLGIPGAWLVSAIFSLHPVHVESVAWITERKNVLSGFFYLLSLHTFLRFYFPVQPDFSLEETVENRSPLFYCLALFLFICGLLSKTVTCSLPAVIMLIFWWKQNRINLKIARFMTPFFGIGLGFGTLTSWLEKVNVGALGPEWDFSFWDRVLIAGRALWFYIGKLVWPFPVIFTYHRWNIDHSSWWQYLFPATFLLLILILWSFRKNIGRGPITAILFFSGTLFPALGFINIYPMRFSFVADHFQYLASIGILSAGVAGITRLPGRLPVVFSISLLLIMGYLTWKQVPVYKNPSTLWRDTVQKNPDAWMAHYNLGNIFIAERKIEEAKTHFQQAILIKPDFPLAPYNLGNALLAHGNNQEAIFHYRTAIRLKPDFVDAHNNLGAALLLEGNNREAISHFQKALEINPDFVDAQNNLEGAKETHANLEP